MTTALDSMVLIDLFLLVTLPAWRCLRECEEITLTAETAEPAEKNL